MPTGNPGASPVPVATKESKKAKPLKLAAKESKVKVKSKAKVKKPAAQSSHPPKGAGSKMSTKMSTPVASKRVDALPPLKKPNPLGSPPGAESKKGELPPLKVASPKQPPAQVAQPSPQPGPGGTGGTGSSGNTQSGHTVVASQASSAAHDSKVVASTGGVSNDPAPDAAPGAAPDAAESKRADDQPAEAGPDETAIKISDSEQDKIARLIEKLSPEEREMFQSEFNRFDKDQSGFINLEEFSLVMKELGAAVGDAELKQVYTGLDSNGDGQLDFNEFMALMVTFMQPSTRDELQEAFKVFDADNSGSVSREELQHIFTVLGESCPISQEDADNLFRMADSDGDGQLNYEEFANFLLPLDEEVPSDDAPADPHNGGGGLLLGGQSA